MTKNTNTKDLLCVPSFLRSIGREEPFEEFPFFGPGEKVFSTVISLFSQELTRTQWEEVFDQLGSLCLTYVQRLSWLSQDLSDYRNQIVLYLTWDRMCVWTGIIWDFFAESAERLSLSIWKELLIESFVHIHQTKQTVPSLFRLVDALYRYSLMRSQRDAHEESLWQDICAMSGYTLQESQIPWVPYIDGGVCCNQEDLEKGGDTGWQARLAFSRHVVSWVFSVAGYSLSLGSVVCKK